MEAAQLPPLRSLQVPLQQAPLAPTPQAPIYVKVSDGVTARAKSNWAATAVVLMGALVIVIVISRILSLSQRVFELESKPSVDDGHLKSIVKAQIDDTVRDMEASARQQHAARVQQMQAMQAAQREKEEQSRKEEEAVEAVELSDEATVEAAPEAAPEALEAAEANVEEGLEAEETAVPEPAVAPSPKAEPILLLPQAVEAASAASKKRKPQGKGKAEVLSM